LLLNIHFACVGGVKDSTKKLNDGHYHYKHRRWNQGAERAQATHWAMLNYAGEAGDAGNGYMAFAARRATASYLRPAALSNR